MKSPCGLCAGRPYPECICHGTGELEQDRAEAWGRNKVYYGGRHPAADKHGNERFVGYTVDVPPEFVPVLDQAYRAAGGTLKTRAAVLRAALWFFMEEYLPKEGTTIEATATEERQPRQLPAGS